MKTLPFNSLESSVSSPKDIIEFIELSIRESVPNLVASRHFYDLEKNDGSRNGYIYAVRPGNASPSQGSVRSVTMEQEFELEIEREFLEKGSNDLAIREAVDRIYSDNELIMKEISLRRAPSVLLVKEPNFSAPKINQTQKTVSIVFTYPIIYRKQIKGDV